MTTSTYTPDVYTGNDVLDTFAITFGFLSVSTNVKVSIKVDSTGAITEKTATTHYNVSGLNVVFTAGNIPATGETIILELSPDFLQDSSYNENSRFPAGTVEADLDERNLESQINKDLISRGFRVDSAEDISSATLAVELPSSGTEVLTVDSAGLGSTSAASLDVLTLPVSVANGGTGVSTLTDGGLLIGSGTGDITSMAVLANGEMVVGDGTTDPVAESGATLRTSIGVGTGDTVQVTAIELGHATDTTLTRASAGVLSVEGSNLMTAASTDTLTNKTFDANGTGNSVSNIDIADLANGTDGELITWDAAGAPAAVAVGTATHVLTSNGVGVAPTFQAAAAGGGGKILQVVQDTKTDTFTMSSTTFADITTLSVSITPSSTSSTILVMANLNVSTNTGAVLHAQLMRDSTAIHVGDTAGSRTRATTASYSNVASDSDTLALAYVDSPATTSATTYKVQLRGNAAAAIYVNRTDSDTDTVAFARGASSIIVMEIDGT